MPSRAPDVGDRRERRSAARCHREPGRHPSGPGERMAVARAVAGRNFAKAGLAAIVTAGLAMSATWTWAADPAPPAAPRRVPRTEAVITLDGAIDEAAWGGALTFDLNIEFSPADNQPAPARTECLILEDGRRLYIAFRAHDPRPEEIRAHLSDRDRLGNDDHVGVLIDSFNDERRAFGFFVNPLGVQLDVSRNDVGGDPERPEDETWDAIWKSAARLTADGYEVEMEIPFSALRFPRVNGDQVWGLLPVRAWPRGRRHQFGAVPIDRNRSCVVCQAVKVTGFGGITPGLNLDLYPTLTASRTDEREEMFGAPLVEGDPDGDLGLTVRWGVTPNLGLGATLNPDFSQVEADVAQLDVNVRFALFYPEKRPFFLEGADFFSTPLNVVYTRTVGDPEWGVKLTGKEGKHALGAAFARDAETLLLFPSNQSSDDDTLEQPNNVGVLRYRYDVGKSSTVGVLATAREGDDYHNRTAGVDAYLRFRDSETLRLQWLKSDTRYPAAVTGNPDLDPQQPSGAFADTALTARYAHQSRDWFWLAGWEDLGKDFRADTGFIPRVDTRKADLGLERIMWGENGSWLTRLFFGTMAYRIEDHDGTLTDSDIGLHFALSGPRQSMLFTRIADRQERYEQFTYDQTIGELFFEFQPTGSLRFEVYGRGGDAIDYDNAVPGSPRPGDLLFVSPEFDLRLGRGLRLSFDHAYERLDVAEGRLYTANLTQLRLVQQFSLRTFARIILQYQHVSREPALYIDPVDAVTKDLLTELLFSYKINPQTLVYAGYSEGRTTEDYVDLTTRERSLFFKLGYAWIP
jgi:hypothetical protein